MRIELTEKRKEELQRELETADSLLKYVGINTETGIVRWTETRCNAKLGGEAGNIHKSDRYRQIHHCGRAIRTHRLIFYSVHGYLPDEIDHKNRNRLDNRIDNLRKASRQENLRNRSIQKNNTSGLAGVYWDKERKKWSAQIKLSKKTKALGRFSCKDDAIKARKEAEAKYFKEFAPRSYSK